MYSAASHVVRFGRGFVPTRDNLDSGPAIWLIKERESYPFGQYVAR